MGPDGPMEWPTLWEEGRAGGGGKCIGRGTVENAERSIRHPDSNPKSPDAHVFPYDSLRGRTVKICPECKMRYSNDATYCFVEGSGLVVVPDPRVGTLLANRYVIEE